MFAKLFAKRSKGIKRKMKRFEIGSECMIETDIGNYSAVFEDISPIGALLRTDAHIEVGETIRIKHASAGELSGLVVRKEDGRLALEFPLDGDSASYALKAITEPMAETPMTKAEGD